MVIDAATAVLLFHTHTLSMCAFPTLSFPPFPFGSNVLYLSSQTNVVVVNEGWGTKTSLQIGIKTMQCNAMSSLHYMA